MGAVRQLRVVDGLEFTAATATTAHHASFPDLSVPEGATAPDVFGYHVDVKIPVVVPERVSLDGIFKAANQQLRGRRPVTLFVEPRQLVWSGFALYGTGERELADVQRFACSLRRALAPFVAGPTRLELQHAGVALAELEVI